MRGECGEIIGIMIHVVPIARLARSSVTSPVMGDDPIAMTYEEHHLSVPVVCTQWPAMAEDNGFSFSPVFEINSRSVFSRDCWHKTSPFGYTWQNLRGNFVRVYSANSTASLMNR